MPPPPSHPFTLKTPLLLSSLLFLPLLLSLPQHTLALPQTTSNTGPTTTTTGSIDSRTPTFSSNCTFYPHYGIALTHNNAAPERGQAKAHVFILGKSTTELGPLGQGFHDNLMGECGRGQVSGWPGRGVNALSVGAGAGAGQGASNAVASAAAAGGGYGDGNGGGANRVGSAWNVAGYEVWFDVGTVSEPGCVERAIWDAERQKVQCTVEGS